MKKYFYYYDKEIGNYKCRLESKGTCQFIKVDKSLNKLNSYRFDEVISKKNNLYLKNNYSEIIIEDEKKFKELGLDNLIKDVTKKDNFKPLKITISKKAKKTAYRIGLIQLSMCLLLGYSSELTAFAKGASDENVANTEGGDATEETIIVETGVVKNESTITGSSYEGEMQEKSFEENTEFETEVLEIDEETNYDEAYLEYDLSDDAEKQEHAYDNYYSIVCTYANKWGVDANLLMEMLTQESGGYLTNLMQIEFSSVNGQSMTLFNFETNSYQNIIFSNNTNYENKGYYVITKSDLNNSNYNIEAAAILLRYLYEQMNENIVAACLCYNQGVGNMNKILNATSYATGLSRDEILADQTNLTFLDYTYVTGAGDENYVQNVLSWCYDPDTPITFPSIDGNELADNSVLILQRN